MKNPPVLNFTEIRLEEAALMRTDGQTDKDDYAIRASWNSTKAPKNWIKHKTFSLVSFKLCYFQMNSGLFKYDVSTVDRSYCLVTCAGIVFSRGLVEMLSTN